MQVKLFDSFNPMIDSAVVRKFSDTFNIFRALRGNNPYILSILLWAKCKTDNLSNPYKF